MKHLRKVLRLAVLRTPPLRDWHRRGLLSADIRKQFLVNSLFQRVLRLNSDCPWSVHFTSKVVMPERIVLGDRVELSLLLSGNCYLQGGNGITIGAGTLFGPGVKIVSANHDPAALRGWVEARPIVIGCGCWIGANAVILPGVQLGDRVIVGAGSVVTRDFPSGTVIGGVPARLLKKVPVVEGEGPASP